MRRLSKTVVLGGAGFLGGWVVDELTTRGTQTTVLDVVAVPDTEGRKGVEVCVGDVLQMDLRAFFAERRPDSVFQLAGNAFVPPSIESPGEDLQRNTSTTLAVLEALRSLDEPPLMAFASSAAVYGHGRYMPMDEDHPFDPLSPYGVSKLAAEQYVKVYAGLHGLSCFSVRPFSLYGPGQRKLVVYDLLERLHGGEDPLTVAAPPDVSRDLVFAEDAARAIVALAEGAPADGEAYNIASGRGTTLEELATTMIGVTGTGAAVRFTGVARPGDPLHWVGDPKRARELGVSCDTPLDEGLRRTDEWLRRSRSRAT